jgi:hypothetical protein
MQPEQTAPAVSPKNQFHSENFMGDDNLPDLIEFCEKLIWNMIVVMYSIFELVFRLD